MPKKNPSNKYLTIVRKLIPEGIKEFINYTTIFPVGDIVKAATSYLSSAPKVLNRDELYERGLRMLRRGKTHIVAVNTVAKEDSQNYILSENNHYEKDYFEQLLRIVQKNRHGISATLPVRRYMDLNDVQKCEEAISLLLYGSDIEIYDSAIPIEFLIRDDEEVLLGFPEGNELSHGVQLRNKSVCATLNKWIESQSGSRQQPTSARVGFKDPPKIASCIEDKRRENGKPILDDSLIHAIDVLERMKIEDPLDATKKSFDDFISWYPNLYDETACKSFYHHLATYAKKHTRSAPSFLDCGCAHALGADILTMDGIKYWGVDASEALLEKAKQKLWNTGAKLIAGDIVKVLLESKGGPKGSPRLPNKFDVIACQGNTFDFFLGDLQKWFVLTLFKSRLKNGGILFLTQKSFTKGESKVERALPRNDGGIDIITYDLDWKGDFVKLDVEFEGHCVGSVIQHPTMTDWLEKACRTLGFVRMEDTEDHWPNWFGPRGAKHPYDAYVFRLEE